MLYPVFDLHCDTADRLAWQSLPAHLKCAANMTAYGPGDDASLETIRSLDRNHGHVSLEKIGQVPWAQCFACFIPDEIDPADAPAFYRHVMTYLSDQAAANQGRLLLARSAREIRPALERGLAVGVRTIENARMLALDPDLAANLARDGVLMASLSWNAAGPLASGHDTQEHLSPLGAKALGALEQAGIVVDVSHLNDPCFSDVASRAERPFVASHSNSRSVCPAPRNLTDDQFRTIRDRGGLVGLNYCDAFLTESGTPTFDDVSRHLDHWLELDGEDVIALGSDFDGCNTPTCIATAAQMPSFQDLLAQRFGEKITRKLCAENALAFFERWAN